RRLVMVLRWLRAARGHRQRSIGELSSHLRHEGLDCSQNVVVWLAVQHEAIVVEQRCLILAAFSIALSQIVIKDRRRFDPRALLVLVDRVLPFRLHVQLVSPIEVLARFALAGTSERTICPSIARDQPTKDKYNDQKRSHHSPHHSSTPPGASGLN